MIGSRLVPLAVPGLLRLLARLPLPVIHGLGAALGLGLALLPTESRRIARRNLDLCFPALAPGERARLLRTTLAETGKALAEAGPMLLWGRERTLGLVREVVGEEALAAAAAGGKGIVFLSPHLGCWELAGLYCSSRYPLTSLYQPLRYPTLDALVHRGRERFGARLVPTSRGGIMALQRALQRGEATGILPDQEPPAGAAGVFAPFFGVPAYTMTLVPRLAQKSGAALVFVFAERLPRGAGFRMHFLRADPEIADPRIEVAASYLNRGVERCIARAPAQYTWVYKRFRARPPGEGRLYERRRKGRWARYRRRRR